MLWNAVLDWKPTHSWLGRSALCHIGNEGETIWSWAATNCHQYRKAGLLWAGGLCGQQVLGKDKRGTQPKVGRKSTMFCESVKPLRFHASNAYCYLVLSKCQVAFGAWGHRAPGRVTTHTQQTKIQEPRCQVKPRSAQEKDAASSGSGKGHRHGDL